MAGNVNNGNNGGNFFLDDDDAKSLGNADYMRKPKSIRRTFPKTVNNPGLELIQEVSSLEVKSTMRENGRVSKEFSSSTTGTKAVSADESTNGNDPTPASESEVRRSEDSSLDMFRAMAKNISR